MLWKGIGAVFKSFLFILSLSSFSLFPAPVLPLGERGKRKNKEERYG
jgi:hypothetical protein